MNELEKYIKKLLKEVKDGLSDIDKDRDVAFKLGFKIEGNSKELEYKHKKETLSILLDIQNFLDDIKDEKPNKSKPFLDVRKTVDELPNMGYNVFVKHNIEGQSFWTRGFLNHTNWTVMTWKGDVTVNKEVIKEWAPIPEIIY